MIWIYRLLFWLGVLLLLLVLLSAAGTLVQHGAGDFLNWLIGRAYPGQVVPGALWLVVLPVWVGLSHLGIRRSKAKRGKAAGENVA